MQNGSALRMMHSGTSRLREEDEDIRPKEDVFEKEDTSRADARTTSEEPSNLVQSPQERIEELPIELVSLADRYVPSRFG